MKTNNKAIFISSFVISAVMSAPAPAAEERFLTRSLYVPVQFELCEHLDKTILYEDEQAVAILPATRIFQFTYYPELDRTEPAAIQLRVEESAVSGEPFVGRLAVTPKGIYTANRAVPLDVAKYKKMFRHKIDVRHEKVHLVLKCRHLCRRELPDRSAP